MFSVLWSYPRLQREDSSYPCGGGVEYLHRSPASRRTRRKWKSRIWDSKIWLRVPRDSDPKMTALARARNNCKQDPSSRQRERASSNCIWDPFSRQRERFTWTKQQLSDSNKNLFVSSRWLLYSKIDWPIDRLSWYKTQTQTQLTVQFGSVESEFRTGGCEEKGSVVV
jgi:hypothetical protein